MEPGNTEEPRPLKERFDEWFKASPRNADVAFVFGLLALGAGYQGSQFLQWAWDAFHDSNVEVAQRLDLIVKLIVGGAGFLVFYATLRRARAAENTAKAGIQTARAATQQAYVAERNLVAERFAKDLELLDEKKSIHSRVGALYDLGQIMVTHGEDYHNTIVDLVASYLREESKQAAQEKDPQSKLPIDTPSETLTDQMRTAFPVPLLRADVATALNVLCRRPKVDGEPRLLLPGAILPWANFRKARLSRVDLRQADLTHADLVGADLTRAFLGYMNLTKALLWGTNFSGAFLDFVDFSGARLQLANLSRTRLWGADFSKANLTDSNLSNAELFQANLTDTKGLTKEQLSQAIGDKRTKVAPELRPDNWPPYEAPKHDS